jgi:hypothetical protein
MPVAQQEQYLKKSIQQQRLTLRLMLSVHIDRMQERMDSLLLEADMAFSSTSESTASAPPASTESTTTDQRSPQLKMAASAIVPAMLRRKSLSLRKSASETFKERLSLRAHA